MTRNALSVNLSGRVKKINTIPVCKYGSCVLLYLKLIINIEICKSVYNVK